MKTVQDRLKDLYKRYEEDPAFNHLRADDINLVPGSGTTRPVAMLVGEAPGALENAKQAPFVGPAGKELAKILETVEINTTADLYLTNVVKYWTRTPSRNVRPPTDRELEDSKKYLLEEIEIINPLYVGLCGRNPTRTIFPNLGSIRSVVGKLLDKTYIPLYHPGVLLYKRDKKQEVIAGYRVFAELIKASKL
jgi:uracil-DNA glycosylase